MTAIKNCNENDFENEVLKSNLPVIVDFWAQKSTITGRLDLRTSFSKSFSLQFFIAVILVLH